MLQQEMEQQLSNVLELCAGWDVLLDKVDVFLEARNTKDLVCGPLVCWTVLAGLAVVCNTGPGCARWVSSSSSIQLVGWTVCLGLQAGLAVVRDTGSGRAWQVSSSSSIQLVGWTVCLGQQVGLAVVRDTGPDHEQQVSSSSSIQLVGWTV